MNPHSNAATHLSTVQALVTSINDSLQCNQLVLNCGATHHMFNSKSFFLSISDMTNITVSTGDFNSALKAHGIGTVRILFNLLDLFGNQLTINQKGSHFSLVTDGKILLRGCIANRLMYVDYYLPRGLLSIDATTLWHNCFGHPGPTPVKPLGLPSGSINCITCNLNKAPCLPFCNQFEHANLLLECVHIDLVGPISPPSVSGFKYFITIVDQSTLFKIIRFLEKKLDAFGEFLVVKKIIENHHDRTLKKLVSDCGGEFLNEKFNSLSRDCGLQHIFAPHETPQHNGFAERANCTMLDKALCMLGA
ncbi:hypothetical protein O181_018536 [Austropuccinia psidii MF-1]|uniref:Integrase catalytic domain-containing protein n=1 Tax=Austropuccinia psidii MF-1 TaxID=1389203 RepID=A0A9Q3C9T4_9BASI|nr:hypothetical protein [Austropuccinia psidii MF-1]